MHLSSVFSGNCVSGRTVISPDIYAGDKLYRHKTNRCSEVFNPISFQCNDAYRRKPF